MKFKVHIEIAFFRIEISIEKGSIGLGPYGLSYCLIDKFLEKNKLARKFPIQYFGKTFRNKWLIRKHTPYFKFLTWNWNKNEFWIRFWGHGIIVRNISQLDPDDEFFNLPFCDKTTIWKPDLELGSFGEAIGLGKANKWYYTGFCGRSLNKMIKRLEKRYKFTHRLGRVPAIKTSRYIIKTVAPFRY